MEISNYFWCLHVIVCIFSCVQCMKVDRYDISMPNVRPNRPELYLCTPVKIDPVDSYYIIGFEPNATMHVVHHIILYGCAKPGASLPVWNCGEMSSEDNEHNPEFTSYSPCEEGSQIIYAWGRDAPALILPEGVGFKVGGDTNIQYLVLQIHYAHIESFQDGHTDSSGISLQYTKRPLNKEAGVLLLGTGGKIPPLATENMETSCVLREDKEVHPFAFRTHTHALGKEVQGYVVKRIDGNIKYEWTLLGKQDPLKPQMFYPIQANTTVNMGDILAARCVMENFRTRETMIGSTGKDEMCNFYLMYWVENTSPLETKYCFTSGPPNYYWGMNDGLNNIPEPGMVSTNEI